MKISIVLAEGAKQIMMTPETEHEKMALKMIGPGETLEVATKWGTYDNEPEKIGLSTQLCLGGWYRRYADEESLMFIIQPDNSKQDNPVLRQENGRE